MTYPTPNDLRDVAAWYSACALTAHDPVTRDRYVTLRDRFVALADDLATGRVRIAGVPPVLCGCGDAYVQRSDACSACGEVRA